MNETQVQNKVAILIERDETLLLIKEKSASGEYLWNIVKGTFEPEKDRDYCEAARRECREEVGVEVTITHLLNIMYLSDHEKGKYLNQFNFIASITSGEPHLAEKDAQASRNEDISEFKWVNNAELLVLSETDFMSKRAYLATRNWMSGERHDLNVLNFIQGY